MNEQLPGLLFYFIMFRGSFFLKKKEKQKSIFGIITIDTLPSTEFEWAIIAWHQHNWIMLQEKVLSALSEAGLFTNSGLIKDKVSRMMRSLQKYNCLIVFFFHLGIAIGCSQWTLCNISSNGRFSSVVQKMAAPLLCGNWNLIGTLILVQKLFIS